MKWQLAVWMLVAAAACRFDESGPPNTIASADAADPSAPDASLVTPDGSPVDDPPDAGVACTDRDGDGYVAVGIPGSNCGEELDCDDDDDRTFPGQTNYFEFPSMGVGGFDFDCDGEEETFDTREGSGCQGDWWTGDCNGTGWLNGIPMCGAMGMWHTCDDVGDGCTEISSITPRMPCR